MKPRPLPSTLPWSYRAVIGGVRPLLRVVTRQDWRGGEHLPETGGFIAAGNHFSEFDPFPMAHFLVNHGHPPYYLAKSSLFAIPLLGTALHHLGQLPVHRGSSRAGDALAAAEKALAEGKCIAIMPEGTLTGDPGLWPMKAKSGVGRLALRTRVPVIPIAQWGAQEVLGHYARVPGRLWTRPVQHVVAGPPVDLSDLHDRADEPRAHAEATARVMAAITAQLAEIRGEQPPAEPHDPARRGAAGAGGTAP